MLTGTAAVMRIDQALQRVERSGANPLG